MMPLLLSLALLAADPPPPPVSPIRLPAIGRKADPTPMPSADAPVPFPAGQVYAFDSPVKCQVRSYPGGCLVVAEKKGPRDISAKFVGGTGDDEDRSFDGPFVYLVRATRAGCVELVMTPYGFTKDEEARSVKFDVLGGCKADPSPVDPPKPIDPPKPVVLAPIAGDGFKVLIVYEAMTEQTLPAAQQAAIFGKKTRDYLNAKCAPGPDGKPKEWRIFDQNTPTDGDTQVWRDAMKRPRASVPWLVVSDGKTGFEGPLPATEADITAILTQFGGK